MSDKLAHVHIHVRWADGTTTDAGVHGTEQEIQRWLIASSKEYRDQLVAQKLTRGVEAVIGMLQPTPAKEPDATG